MINTYISNNMINSLNKRTRNLINTSSKLSSGLRIKSAKDDAAGLAISEKMRSQIKGLEQANKNIQDGISLVQVTDSALEEIQNVTQRINELSIQSANGSLNNEDRNKIQLEVEQLIDEIVMITNTTEFNGVKVLQGSEHTKILSEQIVGGMPTWVVMPSSGALDYPSGSTDHAKATIDFSSLTSSNSKDLIGNGFFSTCCTCEEKYSIKFTDKYQESTGRPNPVISINITGISTPEALVDEIVKQATPKLDHFTQVAKDPNNPSKLIIYDNRPGQLPIPHKYGVLEKGTITTQLIDAKPDLYIQVGPNSNDSKGLKLPRTFIDSLGLSSVNVKTQENAMQAITLLDKSMSYINNERARMGSYNNTLELSINATFNNQENLLDAESRIRDCDIAKEIMKLSKDKILEQATLSIMSIYKDSLSQSVNLLL